MPELKEIVRGLSDIERKSLASLHDESAIGAEELAEKANLQVDSVRRALQWLHEKGLAEIRETRKECWMLTRKGAEALEKGLPEKRLAEKCSQLARHGKEITLDDLKKEFGGEIYALVDGGYFCVLDRIMEEPRDDRGGIHTHFRECVGDLGNVEKIRVARVSFLPVMRRFGIVICALD